MCLLVIFLLQMEQIHTGPGFVSISPESECRVSMFLVR